MFISSFSLVSDNFTNYTQFKFINYFYMSNVISHIVNVLLILILIIISEINSQSLLLHFLKFDHCKVIFIWYFNYFQYEFPLSVSRFLLKYLPKQEAKISFHTLLRNHHYSKLLLSQVINGPYHLPSHSHWGMTSHCMSHHYVIEWRKDLKGNWISRAKIYKDNKKMLMRVGGYLSR